MQSISIYLAGSIQKGHEKGNELFWTEDHLQELRQHLTKKEISFLNPAFRTDDLSDQISVFGRDMTQVFCADVVLVDARDRRGLGVGAEMMWAKVHNIPVVTWAPSETHYHKSKTTILGIEVKNFIHPFIDALSDQIVSTLAEAALFIEKALANPEFKAKGIEFIMSAMEHYKSKQLQNDLPMQEIMSLNPILKRKIGSPVAWV